MAASEQRWCVSKQSTIGDPKLKPPKRAHNLMPLFMKSAIVQVLRCPLGGREHLGKNASDCLMFLTWSYATWVFAHLQFRLHGVNALTLAKWAHSESGGIPNGVLRKHGVADNFMFRISAFLAACFATTSIALKKAAVHWTEAAEWTTFNGPAFQPCQNHLLFRATLWLLQSEGKFVV